MSAETPPQDPNTVDSDADYDGDANGPAEEEFTKADDTLTAEMFPAEPDPQPAPSATPPSPDPASAAPETTAETASGGEAYRVLARKYRPTNFDELIGQEALVRTLTNAIKAGRVAQAFMLTGVRGVGKTTTARIIAKALNCIGPDGNGGPTASPCGVCANCTAIAGDRHVDVLEMDAASRTGVGDVRELIEGARYRPVSARYKVYILDEVHMFSNQAFNALLKTLEEPPEHLKFVFATTEIRKVPVTILSRCQRFDLRRVPADKLVTHFGNVAGSEGVEADPEALTLVARAADGSVRDGLSILDQAIALAEGPVTSERVRDMLGLADRERIFDLFEAAMKGDAPGALTILGDLYDVGADPSVVLQDLLELCHWLTRAKLVPGLAEDPTTPELERSRGAPMAAGLQMSALARAWQMLLKGLDEVRAAPSPIQAAEMVLIRLIHVAELPPPADLVKQLRDGGGPARSAAAAPPPPAASGGGAPGGAAPGGGAPSAAAPMPQTPTPGSTANSEPTASLQTAAAPALAQADPPGVALAPMPGSFEAVLELLDSRREALVLSQLRYNVHLVRFQAGHIEIRPKPEAPNNLHGKLGALLTQWTGQRWMVSLSNDPGDPTIAEQRAQAEAERTGRAERDSLVVALRDAFPDSKVVKVTPPEGIPAPAPIEADEASDPDDSPFFDPEDPGFDPDFIPD